MTTVAEIVSAIADRTRPDRSPGWDPVGLQLGDPGAVVSGIAVCHEVNDEVISRLEEQAVDLLITYHPLLFTPTNRLLAGRSAGARSYQLISAGVSLAVTHTDFDAASGGAADALAAFFDLTDVRAFAATHEIDELPIGRYGSFEGSLGTVEAKLADAYGPIGLRVSGDRDADVDVVAVVPGSGGDFIAAAAEVATVLVTGDVSHHRAVAARDVGLAIVDPGHTSTERPGMGSLVSLVRDAAQMDVVDMTDIDPRTWE